MKTLKEDLGVLLFERHARGVRLTEGEWEVRDVQNIADILVDPEGSLDRRNHWEKASHSLLAGAILHVHCEAPPESPVDTTISPAAVISLEA